MVEIESDRRKMVEQALRAEGVDSSCIDRAANRIMVVLGNFETSMPRPVVGFYLVKVEASVPAGSAESEIVAALDRAVQSVCTVSAQLELWDWADRLDQLGEEGETRG